MATHHQVPLRIGLTGGAATGKSTVASAFASHGVPVLSADAIARQLTRPGAPALERIREHFGESVFHPGGELDRAALREIAFTDDEARTVLEHILHPPIRDAMREWVAGLDSEYCVLEVPLLRATDAGTLVDRVLVVDIPEALQVERLRTRDGIDGQQAERILAAQPPRESRLRMADDLLDNSGAPDALAAAVERLHALYTDIAREGDPGRSGSRLP